MQDGFGHLKKISLLPILIILGATTAHAETSNVTNDILLSIWKQRFDLQSEFPEVSQGNLDNLKKWATTTGWKDDKRLAALIPPGQVPYYLFDSLLSIWKERSDLQKSYPEVAQNNLVNLKKWAVTTGWDQDPRLSILVPQGEVPSYQKNLLLQIWKNSADLQKTYPEVKNNDLTKLRNWATTTGWNEDKRLAALIPPGEVPKYLDDSLLSIWKERTDLQKSFPEVAQNNLVNLKKWAVTFGWNEDKRLAPLILPSQVPKYLDNSLLSIWKEKAYLQKSYPEVAKGDLTKLRNWATTTGWNEDPRLVVLTPAYLPHEDPSSSFHITDMVLLSIWNERIYLQKAFPEVAQGNLDNLKKWAVTFGWNEDKRLAALIPPGKVPSYLQKASFPVSNDILLSIWKERSYLQKSYPEVAKGNLTNLQKWATTTGWNEDKRLSALIPPGKVPQHLTNP